MMNVVSVLAENKHGVLLRVAGVLAARGINIERLTVSPTAAPGVSRITLAFENEPAQLPLILQKIDRLVNVIGTEMLTGKNAVAPEMRECGCAPPQWPSDGQEFLIA